MSMEEFNDVPPKHIWTIEVKKGMASVVMGNNMPFVPISHFVVAVVHEVRVFGEFGKLDKRMDQACAVINYGMTTNHVVVLHKKDAGQRLKNIKVDSLKDWVTELCNSFEGSLDSTRTFQGDGDAPMEISRDGIGSGVPSHAFTNGSVMTSDQFHLYNIKAQKEAGHHLSSEETRQREAERARLMNQITRVTSGNIYCFNFFFLYFC
jgi:hypothetical protein